jgi:molybdopterin converting factor small subunit
MQVRVLFFGATADYTGQRSMDFAFDDRANVTSALNRLLDSFPRLNDHKLRFAVNQEYVSKDQVLRDGDVLAVFTAVSGG